MSIRAVHCLDVSVSVSIEEEAFIWMQDVVSGLDEAQDPALPACHLLPIDPDQPLSRMQLFDEVSRLHYNNRRGMVWQIIIPGK